MAARSGESTGIQHERGANGNDDQREGADCCLASRTSSRKRGENEEAHGWALPGRVMASGAVVGSGFTCGRFVELLEEVDDMREINRIVGVM